ncbi:unnamed protein product [Cochlearia groenlandica]
MARDSDSDYAYRLKMEEAFAASSISSRSRAPPHQQPPPSPILHTSGVATTVENRRYGDSTSRGDSTDARDRNGGRGDSGRIVGEGNSKGKGKALESVRSGYSRFGNKKPSPATQWREILRPSQSAGEGSSKDGVAAGKTNGEGLYRLYFKGLVSENSGKGKMIHVVAGFGFAICDQKDMPLYEMKGPLIRCDTSRQGVEIKALTRGLNEALKLGIKKIAFFCDYFPVFQYVTGIWIPKQKKISMLMSDLQQIRQQFTVSQPVLVAGNDVKFAYKLARESIVSQLTPREDSRQAKAAWKEECIICYDDTTADRMFVVDKCHHRFCLRCVKQHVEVKLLHGMVPKCPDVRCKSELVIDACSKLLTPKLSELWNQRIKENAIPVAERVYCPFPKCSALMSKTKISESARSLLSVYPTSGVRRCVECRGLFCVDCKVPWHGKMSCTEYKKLHPNPPADDVKLKSLANNKMWRQCSKCQHMIELVQGCNHIVCRCKFEFCYNCGGEWDKKWGCTKGCPPSWNEEIMARQDPPAGVYMGPNMYFDGADDGEYYQDFDYGANDYLSVGRRIMNNFGLEIPPGFDPFFALPDSIPFFPHMLSPKSRRQFYNSDHKAEASARREGKAAESSQSHFPHNREGEYFGKYGKYTIVYDSDGNEIEDYTNPFHPDYYPHF